MKFRPGVEAAQKSRSCGTEVNCVIYLANDHNANGKIEKRRWKKIHSLAREFIGTLEPGNVMFRVGLRGCFTHRFPLDADTVLRRMSNNGDSNAVANSGGGVG